LIVVDASVLANALTDDGPIGGAARDELARDVHWAGPEHLVVETFSAIRALLLGAKIDQQRADDAIDALATAAVELQATAPLLARMWELRNNVSGYDAAYVAAAEANACPMVTADLRLSRANGPGCEFRVALPDRT
jgi:predicted nucleic acid-binding protein